MTCADGTTAKPTMTVQEAIKICRRVGFMNGFTTEQERLAVGILIRAAEENEGRKLASRFLFERHCEGTARTCPQCPLHKVCAYGDSLHMPCRNVNGFLSMWFEAAKKEGKE